MDWRSNTNREYYHCNGFELINRAVIKDPINRLIKGLKGLDDKIEVIGVVGGHPEFYRDELQTRFKRIPIFVSDQSIFANLRGFQALANEAVRRSQVDA